jgi:hypothetical protein
VLGSAFAARVSDGDRAIGTWQDARLIDGRASRFQRIKHFEDTATGLATRQKSLW